ncbi:MAG TPA: aromatic ring-hydroxylating dioxygenase subunit alpha [Novosphingobium sp.]|nr:aromatic ring-hydroxylating dioxygenase subunit alpha [Novosphingobium sp.]
MDNARPDPVMTDAIRDDYLPKDDYVSREFAALEAEYLWPAVWQIACRVEELPRPGSFIVYDIGKDSVVVLRGNDGELRAFFNACPHRGRRLLSESGQLKQIQCRFHGWKWNLDGCNIHVLDRDDWAGCLSTEEIALNRVHVDHWGGFVFINMAENPEPLEQFLAPAADLLKTFEFEKMRFRWYKTVRLNCNWKTNLEAFIEGYHVAQTHPQLLDYFDDYTRSKEYGLHGAFWYPAYPPIQQSPRLEREAPADYRSLVLEYVEEFDKNLMAMVTPRSYAAAQRLRTELPETASPGEVLTKWAEWTREAAEEEGAGWPPVTPDELEKSHADWHFFPNTAFLHGNIDGLLWYRTRPDGDDPNHCLFDVWSLVRYAPGDEPPLQREFYENWRDYDGWGRILKQDFMNLEDVQRGMNVRSFKASRTNPVQERVVVNFHRNLHAHIARERAKAEGRT